MCSPDSLLHTKPPLSPGTSSPVGPGVAVTAGHHEPKVAFSWPAMGPHSSMQHNTAAVQERIWQLMAGTHTKLLRAAGTDRGGCVRSHTSEYLFHPLQPLSQAPASQLPVCSSRRENTGAEAKDSRVSVQLVVLTHCLALLKSFNPSAFSSLTEKGQRIWV